MFGHECPDFDCGLVGDCGLLRVQFGTPLVQEITMPVDQ